MVENQALVGVGKRKKGVCRAQAVVSRRNVVFAGTA